MTGTSTARPSVVVLGGGYGGINVAKALDEVAEVSLVDPAEAFFHNVAALRALASARPSPSQFSSSPRQLQHQPHQRG